MGWLMIILLYLSTAVALSLRSKVGALPYLIQRKVPFRPAHSLLPPSYLQPRTIPLSSQLSPLPALSSPPATAHHVPDSTRRSGHHPGHYLLTIGNACSSHERSPPTSIAPGLAFIQHYEVFDRIRCFCIVGPDLHLHLRPPPSPPLPAATEHPCLPDSSHLPRSRPPNQHHPPRSHRSRLEFHPR